MKQQSRDFAKKGKSASAWGVGPVVSERPMAWYRIMVWVLSTASIVSLVLVQKVNAQLAATAAINGTVQDPSGAVVPGAAVTLTNTRTGVKRSTVTGDTGRYVLVNVLPGEYTLEVAKQGFATATQQAFELFVNQTASFDFTLTLGGGRQEVKVEAVAAKIEGSTAELGTVVTRTFVNDLPLNGRQFTQLLSLTPGASPANSSQNVGGGQAYPLGPAIFPAMNGQQNRSNVFSLDGVIASETTFSTFSVAPTVDDIQEFKVQSHNDDAQFGRVAGGIVNVVSKSGTNEFHGALWEFIRNNVFDARNPFVTKVDPLRQNQFGGNVGGPVIVPHYNGRNKTFFFFSYEGFRRVVTPGLSGLAITPTDAQLAGDLSGIGTQIYNPYSTRPDPANPGQVIRDPFMCDASGNPLPTASDGTQAAGTACGKIPSSLIDANMVKFAQIVFPKAGPPVLGAFNTVNPARNVQDLDQYSIRIDENLNAHNSIWFRYTWDKHTASSPGGVAGFDFVRDTPSKNWGVNYLHGFNPTTLVNVQFGHTDLHNLAAVRWRPSNGMTADQLVQQTNFSSNFACDFKPLTCLVPGVSLPGFITVGESIGFADPLSDIEQLTGDFTKVLGNHTFKAGGYVTSTDFFGFAAGNQDNFSADQTANPQAPGTGSPLASFLLGFPSNANIRHTGQWIRHQVSMGFYGQDQWKASRNLTVNAGLRWEVAYWPRLGLSRDLTDAIGELDLNNGTYILQREVGSCAQLGKAPCIPGGLPQPNIVVSPDGHLWRSPKDNFQPRLGLAYRLNDKTALRASAGIFFDTFAGVIQEVQGLGSDWPSVGAGGVSGLNAASAGPPTVTAENPFAAGISSLPAPTPFTQGQWYRDPQAKNAYSEQWNFGVQRQITANTLLEADFVGSHSSRLTVGPFANVAKNPGPGDPSLRRPYPYISPTFYDQSIGRGSYNSFQFRLDRRLDRGWGYLLSYTWSKTIDIGCDGFFSVEGCAIQNPYDLNNDRSVAGFDLTHVLTFASVYRIPKVPTGNKVVNQAANGWQLSGIFTATSGLPYDVGVSGDPANTGNLNLRIDAQGFFGGFYYERLNLVGNPTLKNPSPEQWFNPSAFAVPAVYTFGGLGRNSLRSDGLVSLDLSVLKEFPVNENKRLEFRAEMFNFTNTPSWGIPTQDFNNPNFGKIFATRSIERQIQFALKFYF